MIAARQNRRAAFILSLLVRIAHVSSEFCFQLPPVWQIELIPADENLIGDVLQGILHNQPVLIGSEYDADGLGVALSIHFLAVIIQIEVHLSDIFMLNLAALEVDEYEAFQNPVIENEIYFIVSPADHHFLLPPHIGEALA